MSTATRASTVAPPPISQIWRQPSSGTSQGEAISAERKMPSPTPAKCTEVSCPCPPALSRAVTRAEAKTSTKALAIPPAKRRSAQASGACVAAISAVVRALSARAAAIQARARAEKPGRAAISAPAR
ncbi:MAG: hypothetical protein AAF503_15395 [Pseudomonadota bacterium]